LVLGDPSFDHFGAEVPHDRQSAVLVHAHEATVTDYIGCKDGSQTALNGVLHHSIVPQLVTWAPLQSLVDDTIALPRLAATSGPRAKSGC
jgi:hypothetical protein